MKNEKIELAHYFTNFRGAIYYLTNTYKEEAGRRKGVDSAVIKRDMKTDLANVPLALPRIAGEVDNFCNEHITDKELQKAAADELLSIIDKTRNLIEDGNYDEVEQRLSYLESIEAIILKQFSDVLNVRPIIKLKLNASNAVIYDLFRQLRTVCTQNATTPVLTQNNAEIAKFLKLYVDGFENTELSTIENQLNRE